jgi:hypothetical protein
VDNPVGTKEITSVVKYIMSIIQLNNNGYLRFIPKNCHIELYGRQMQHPLICLENKITGTHVVHPITQFVFQWKSKQFTAKDKRSLGVEGYFPPPLEVEMPTEETKKTVKEEVDTPTVEDIIKKYDFDFLLED